MSDTDKVVNKIISIYDRRRAAVFAISKKRSQNALQFFKRHQSRNQYWKNESSDALNRMFTRTFKIGDIVGWRMAHGVNYGVYLELANDKQNQSILPIVLIYGKRTFDDVRKLY